MCLNRLLTLTIYKIHPQHLEQVECYYTSYIKALHIHRWMSGIKMCKEQFRSV